MIDQLSANNKVIDKLRFDICTPEYVLNKGYPLLLRDDNIVTEEEIKVGEKENKSEREKREKRVREERERENLKIYES